MSDSFTVISELRAEIVGLRQSIELLHIELAARGRMDEWQPIEGKKRFNCTVDGSRITAAPNSIDVSGLRVCRKVGEDI